MKIPLLPRLAKLAGISGGGNCHGQAGCAGESLDTIVIVGCPNVGKSVIFNHLTGARAIVSNYPGTTVTIMRGKSRIEGMQGWEVMDTPGMYSLLPITEEERVSRSVLIREKPRVVLQVVDGKDLERMLPLTMQLIEAGLPLMLAVNMMDEVEAAGMKVDAGRLEQELGIPVVTTAATSSKGMEMLRARMKDYVGNRCSHCS